MAKFYGGYVKSGKLGSSVFTISKGITIERQYQPRVFNPKTIGQIGQRAKFRLLSGLASVVAPFACLQKEGLQTEANVFIRKNMGLASFSDGIARIDMPKIQISGGSDSFVTPTFEIQEGIGKGSISAEDVKNAGFDGVVFLVVGTKRPDIARVIGKVVLSPSDGKFSVEFPTISGYAEYHLFSYGIKLSDKGVSRYGSLESINGAGVIQVSVMCSMIAEGMMTSSTSSYAFAHV